MLIRSQSNGALIIEPGEEGKEDSYGISVRGLFGDAMWESKILGVIENDGFLRIQDIYLQ